MTIAFGSKEFLLESRAMVEAEQCGSWRVGLEEAEFLNLKRSAELLREYGFAAEFCETDPLGAAFTVRSVCAKITASIRCDSFAP